MKKIGAINMGFFNSFFENVKDSMINNLARNYRDMPIEQLKSKWNEEFKNRSYTKENMYNEPSPLSVLDETYAFRTGKRSWKSLCESKLQAEEKSRREKIAAEEKARKQRKESEKANQQFNSALSSNEMVAEIIKRINDLSYDAFYIRVNSDELICENSETSKIYFIKYKKYGYPELDEDKRKLLCKYISDSVKLHYIAKGNDSLELNDAPGGMKSSW